MMGTKQLIRKWLQYIFNKRITKTENDILSCLAALRLSRSDFIAFVADEHDANHG